MAVAKDQARGLSSRVAALDGIFIRPPHDAKEGNRRIGLLQYVISTPFQLSVDLPPASP